MRHVMSRLRGWWYRRGHRPPLGHPLHSPSLHIIYMFHDNPLTFQQNQQRYWDEWKP